MRSKPLLKCSSVSRKQRPNFSSCLCWSDFHLIKASDVPILSTSPFNTTSSDWGSTTWNLIVELPQLTTKIFLVFWFFDEQNRFRTEIILILLFIFTTILIELTSNGVHFYLQQLKKLLYFFGTYPRKCGRRVFFETLQNQFFWSKMVYALPMHTNTRYACWKESSYMCF